MDAAASGALWSGLGDGVAHGGGEGERLITGVPGRVGVRGGSEAGRKIPLNYASRYTSRSGGLKKSAYLPFKVNSSGVMPIVFSASSLPLPSTVARFVGLAALKKAAVALNPGVAVNCHSSLMH